MEQFTLEKYLADPTRKVVTRDGEDVRILCIDRNDSVYPIVALVKYDEKESIIEYTTRGEYITGKNRPDSRDLFFAPNKQSRWVYMCRGTHIDGAHWEVVSQAFTCKEAATECMEKNEGFALTEITWEE